MNPPELFHKEVVTADNQSQAVEMFRAPHVGGWGQDSSGGIRLNTPELIPGSQSTTVISYWQDLQVSNLTASQKAICLKIWYAGHKHTGQPRRQGAKEGTEKRCYRGREAAKQSPKGGAFPALQYAIICCKEQ